MNSFIILLCLGFFCLSVAGIGQSKQEGNGYANCRSVANPKLEIRKMINWDEKEKKDKQKNWVICTWIDDPFKFIRYNKPQGSLQDDRVTVATVGGKMFGFLDMKVNKDHYCESLVSSFKVDKGQNKVTVKCSDKDKNMHYYYKEEKPYELTKIEENKLNK